MKSTSVIFVMIGIILFALAMSAVAITDYVVRSVGLYRLAKRYQINNPWMAWIPAANAWLLGKVTETLEAYENKKHKWSTWLLVLSICSMGGVLLFFVIYFIMLFMVGMQMSSFAGGSNAFISLFVLVMIAVSVVMQLVSVTYFVCNYVCIFKNFEVIAPQKTIKYFLLSLLVPLAYGILLMKCCKKGQYEPVRDAQMDGQTNPKAGSSSVNVQTQTIENAEDVEYEMVSEETYTKEE